MDTSILRIVDASLNRAAEGLRVVEDYTRFALDDAHLSGLAKTARHDLARVARAPALVQRQAARDTQADVGTTITSAAEQQRADALDVCRASMERVKQSLRSLEEYGKAIGPELASGVEALRYRFYTLEKAIEQTWSNRQRLADVRLYVLIDAQSPVGVFETLVKSLIEAGVGAIQLRDKSLSDRDLVARARRLVALTRESTAVAIVNDRPDIGAAAQADGVHLGQDELSVKDARTIVGPEALIGVSTHGIEQARQAVLDGADYLGAGPTFASRTKSFTEFPGLEYLRQVASEITLPTFAIGGITAENLPEVLETGISRVAVSGAVTSAAEPGDAARQLDAHLKSSAAAV